MIANIDIQDKSFGDKTLYRGLSFTIDEGEKIGFVGRNGTGKSTLIKILIGEDKDFDGEVFVRKGMILAHSRQEHHDFEDLQVIDYILNDLPQFTKLKHILETYPETMGESTHKMQVYSDALDEFGRLGYFEVENEVEMMLGFYQVSGEMAHGPLKNLSGGQKRLVELVKVQRARAHLALIDEPTNHMDYVAKANFISWMKSTDEAVLVITHDRDVLNEVDKIVEIRDGQADIFKGNYDDYLRINAARITSEINQFSVDQQRISNLKEDVVRFRRLKERSRDPGTIARFKSLERRAATELEELQRKEKPSFWIDKDSVDQMNSKVSDAYEEHKTKNITIRTSKKSELSSHALIEVDNLSLGYGDKPLFSGMKFQLREGDRLQLHGRNGVGKSTLAKAILAEAGMLTAEAHVFEGAIKLEKSVRIGVYEQELHNEFLNKTFREALEEAYKRKGILINDQQIKQLLGDYLFNPIADVDVPLSRFSGGQKARFQIMAMLAANPNVLILDEPTNHLDLPSIEELEYAISQYHGAVIYISHDSYFVKSLGGMRVTIGK